MRAESEALFDRWFPRRGPCGFCGEGDGRHRLLDSIVERWRAGETVAALAFDHDVEPAAIHTVLIHWDEKESA